MINIDSLESLSTKESRKQYLTRKYGDMWNLRRFDGCNGFKDHINPYKLAERICKYYIGKPFDDAFSYYCTKVTIEYQHYFLERFKPGWRRATDYYVDDQGNVQKSDSVRFRSKPKPIHFQSWDYKEKQEQVYKKSCDTGRYEFFTKRYVASGFWKQFENSNDPEYKRLRKQKEQLQRLALIQYKKDYAEYAMWLLYDTKQKRKQAEKELDLIKRDAHGFDDNSFKGIEYHGGSRKRNKQ